METQEGRTEPTTPEPSEIDGTGPDAELSTSEPQTELSTSEPQTKRIAREIEQLIQQFSRPASQITGRLICLFGVMLVVTAFVLGIIHMLVPADFVAAIIAGTVLSIAGILTLTTDYIGAQRAAARELAKSNADTLEKRMNGYFGSNHESGA